MTLDWSTASIEERVAEVARRNRNRAAGRSPTDDGPVVKPEWATRAVDAVMAPARSARRICVLPWSMLVPDNQRFAPALRMVRGKPKAVLVMTKEYRAAKKRAVVCLSEQRTETITVPCRLVATLYEPNTHRRDLANYAKLTHDALTDAKIIADDSLIADVRWMRAGVDIDHPRLELILTVI